MDEDLYFRIVIVQAPQLLLDDDLYCLEVYVSKSLCTGPQLLLDDDLYCLIVYVQTLQLPLDDDLFIAKQFMEDPANTVG